MIGVKLYVGWACLEQRRADREYLRTSTYLLLPELEARNVEFGPHFAVDLVAFVDGRIPGQQLEPPGYVRQTFVADDDGHRSVPAPTPGFSLHCSDNQVSDIMYFMAVNKPRRRRRVVVAEVSLQNSTRRRRTQFEHGAAPFPLFSTMVLSHI